MPGKPYKELICPTCKKKFICYYTSKWAYQKNKRLYCSYGCKKKGEEQP